MQAQRAHFGAGILSLVALSGCASISTPAVIVDQTPQGRRELAGVIGGALHTGDIALADDALMAAPLLLIERSPVRDERGLPLNGRDLSRPEVFRLFLRGRRCVLMHSPSGRHWTLKYVQCRAP